ncbi:MAG: NYN domain-containing protein [Candidatus Pacebacteria bacterium]|nr:NYN domain-containing protein [Candidatus Paceibacterota bacterium]
MRSSAFIDASNLFYGGKKSLGWSIDYAKLRTYLHEKYGVDTVYYFGGIEIHRFQYDYLANETVPIKELEHYLSELVKKEGSKLTEAKLVLLDRHLKRARFYRKLEQFGYTLVLKPVKTYEDEDGTPRRKANCDVDMTYYLMRDRDQFDRAIVLTGDGDFLPVLKHLRGEGKEVLMLARGPRTAKEIRQFAGSDFRDFEYLRERLKQNEKEV